jgi:hypothetical protein
VLKGKTIIVYPTNSNNKSSIKGLPTQPKNLLQIPDTTNNYGASIVVWTQTGRRYQLKFAVKCAFK